MGVGTKSLKCYFFVVQFVSLGATLGGAGDGIPPGSDIKTCASALGACSSLLRVALSPGGWATFQVVASVGRLHGVGSLGASPSWCGEWGTQGTGSLNPPQR